MFDVSTPLFSVHYQNPFSQLSQPLQRKGGGSGVEVVARNAQSLIYIWEGIDSAQHGRLQKWGGGITGTTFQYEINLWKIINLWKMINLWSMDNNFSKLFLKWRSENLG